MFGLGYVVAAGFGLGSLMGNPRRHGRRRKTVRHNAPISKIDARSMRHVLKTHGFRCNPGSIDAEGARELELFIVNDSYTYRQVQAIIANLAKKIKKGTYDHAKAVKLWGYAADTGAQRYTKEFGAGGANGSYGDFNKPTRMAVAAELQKYYQDELNEAAGVKTNPAHRGFYRRSKNSSVFRPGDHVRESDGRTGVVVSREQARKHMGRIKLGNLLMPVRLASGSYALFRLGTSSYVGR